MSRPRGNSSRKVDWKPTGDHANVTPAQIVRDRRNQLNMSQGELARLLEYDNVNFISMIEVGQSFVPIIRAMEIAEALDLPKIWFFERVLSQSKLGGEPGHRGTGKDAAKIYSFLFGDNGVLLDKLAESLEQAKRDVQLVYGNTNL